MKYLTKSKAWKRKRPIFLISACLFVTCFSSVIGQQIYNGQIVTTANDTLKGEIWFGLKEYVPNHSKMIYFSQSEEKVDRYRAKKLKSVQFEDQNGTSYNDHTGYLIDAQHNTLYKFYVGEQSLIPSNKAEGLKIWVLTKQEKIALLEEQGWQKEPKDKAVDLLKLELKDILLSSEEEVREILD